MRSTAILASILALSLASLATGGEWQDASGNALTDPTVALSTKTPNLYWLYGNDGGDNDSTIFSIPRGWTAKVTFDPDLATEGTATAQIQICHCPARVGGACSKPASNPERTCFCFPETPMTGAIAWDQDPPTFALRLSGSCYYIRSTTDPGAKDARVAVEAE